MFYLQTLCTDFPNIVIKTLCVQYRIQSFFSSQNTCLTSCFQQQRLPCFLKKIWDLKIEVSSLWRLSTADWLYTHVLFILNITLTFNSHFPAYWSSNVLAQFLVSHCFTQPAVAVERVQVSCVHVPQLNLFRGNSKQMQLQYVGRSVVMRQDV